MRPSWRSWIKVLFAAIDRLRRVLLRSWSSYLAPESRDPHSPSHRDEIGSPLACSFRLPAASLRWRRSRPGPGNMLRIQCPSFPLQLNTFSFFQPRLLQHAVQSPRRQVVAEFATDGDQTLL